MRAFTVYSFMFGLGVSAPLSALPGAAMDTFPRELSGVWNPVPYECGEAQAGENDMRFEISGKERRNFEDLESVEVVVRISDAPLAWRIQTVSNVVGGDAGQSRIYIRGARYLFVTDGGRMDQYRQCD